MMNVKLSSEGAPEYVDQSPSYIYKNPPMEYNQNGVALPMPDKNAKVSIDRGTNVNAVFTQQGKKYGRKMIDEETY